MGNSIKSQTSLSSPGFMKELKYYSSELDPISKQIVKVYNYEEIFIHQINHYFSTHEQLTSFESWILLLDGNQNRPQKKPIKSSIKLPMALQSVYYIKCMRHIEFCADVNFKVEAYEDHYNFTIKDHLSALQQKIEMGNGNNFCHIGLLKTELFYIIKQLAEVGAFLEHHRLDWQNLNTSSLYIDTGYEIRVPVSSIKPAKFNLHKQKTKADLFQKIQNQCSLLAPQQIMKSKYGRTGNISRVFSLGMIIMECYSLLDSFIHYYYPVQPYKSQKQGLPLRIRLQKLNEDIKQIKDSKLAGILSRMLQVDPKKRITFTKLFEVLSGIDEKQFQTCIIIQ